MCSKLFLQTCQPFLGCHSCLSDVSFVCSKIESYNEDNTSKESLSALLRATSALPDVFQVSDVLFIVCGFPAPTIHSVIATQKLKMGLWLAAPKTATARHLLPKEDMNMWKKNLCSSPCRVAHWSLHPRTTSIYQKSPRSHHWTHHLNSLYPAPKNIRAEYQPQNSTWFKKSRSSTGNRWTECQILAKDFCTNGDCL